MSVVKPEMIHPGIDHYDVLPLSFLKKSVYTGSKGNLRFRLEKAELAEAEGAAPKAVLRCETWTTPFAYPETPPEEIAERTFDFSEDGLLKAEAYLTSLLEQLRGG